jgi:hypothetical protein
VAKVGTSNPDRTISLKAAVLELKIIIINTATQQDTSIWQSSIFCRRLRVVTVGTSKVNDFWVVMSGALIDKKYHWRGRSYLHIFFLEDGGRRCRRNIDAYLPMVFM